MFFCSLSSYSASSTSSSSSSSSMALQKKKLNTLEEDEEELQYTGTGTPIRYLPLDRVYSVSAPCAITASGASNVMSKKVKARKLTDDSYLNLNYTDLDVKASSSSRKKQLLPFRYVYTRRRKKIDVESDSLIEANIVNQEDDEELKKIRVNKKRKKPTSNFELARLGINSSVEINVDCDEKIGRRGRRLRNACIDITVHKQDSIDPNLRKKWIALSCENVDGTKFVGMQCKVYWPLDDEWYTGSVTSYCLETGKHHVSYDDGQEEDVIFVKEEIKFYICNEEMQQLDLKIKLLTKEAMGINNEELLVLAAIFDDCTDFEVGDIVWAKLTGHAMWPAVVVQEADVGVRKGFKSNHDDWSIPVQFFGTHDFAWISLKQVVSFLRGLHSGYHLKNKQSRFRRSLQEAKV